GGETREERALGGDGDADLPPDLAGITPCVEAAHAYPSGIGQEYGRNQLEGCGFSAAVRAEQPQDLGAACGERNVFQGNGFAASLPSKPIEQSWTMAKYLADGFENDLVHENGTRKCEPRRESRNHEAPFGRASKTLYYSGVSRSARDRFDSGLWPCLARGASQIRMRDAFRHAAKGANVD